ncbi:MAG TPA: MFS transporter, partial [Syntrophobacteraceae bacterium]|nr:MFS transporter [Syntrophobacteraceae bacterium]
DIRWLALLCVARMGFSFVFTTYSAALPLLKHDWLMSATQAGVVQSAWHLGFLVSLFAVGFLGDRFGAKRTYLWSAVAASISALGFAVFASDFVSGAILYGLAGLCSGGSYTPGLALIAERFPPATRGRAMGIYLAAGSLAYALSVVLSSQLFPAGGWRLAFLANGSMPAVGLAVSIWVLHGTANIIHDAPPGQEVWHAIPALLKNKPALLLMFAYTSHNWELLGMWAWLPAYLGAAAQALGGQAWASGRAVEVGVFLSGLTYLTSMLGSLVGGDLSDRWGRSLTMLLFACASLILSFSFGWMMGWSLSVLFVAAACYNLASIADSSVNSTALTELVEPRYIGAAYALRSVLGFGAGAVSPWVFGLVLDTVRGMPLSSERLAWGLAWTSLGLGALPGPLLILWLRRRPEAALMARGRR